MVAERLLDLRSPAFLVTLPQAFVTMSHAAASLGEDFVPSGMANFETFEMSIGGVMVRIGLAAAGGFLGAAALSEAKEATPDIAAVQDAIVEKLTKVFGKYQKEQDSSTTINGELSDIQENDLDGTPDRLRLDDDEQTDPATASVTDKRTNFEALAANTTKSKTDAEPKTKKASTE